MKALILYQQQGKSVPTMQEISQAQYPEGNVTVNINWSTLNYKDALIISGKWQDTKHFPMIPGIDLAGVVEQSEDPRFTPGQEVLLTGWGIGEHHWGGLAQQARVQADWLLPLPPGMTQRQAMIIGTAGLTAMLSIMALEDGELPLQDGKIIVTGASGGVGSTAVALLHALHAQVTAVTGRVENSDYLATLGAQEILPRENFTHDVPPLGKQLWSGSIDTVGGTILANILAQIKYRGTVAACGLAHSTQLPTTVLPFILRNIRLQGIDSVYAPASLREIAWQRLNQLLPSAFYQQVTTEIPLTDAVEYANRILANQVTGRILVNTQR